MRRPRMSTGAWIFTGLICAAVIAPASVYAASLTKIALYNSSGTYAAAVTPDHQLLTTPTGSNRVVRISGGSNTANCKTIYTPPAGKAIVVTSVVYDFGSGSANVEQFGGLGPVNCTAIYDQFDGVLAFQTIQHTYPTGLPMSSIAISNSTNKLVNVFIVGYLINSTSLPSGAAANGANIVKAAVPAR